MKKVILSLLMLIQVNSMARLYGDFTSSVYHCSHLKIHLEKEHDRSYEDNKELDREKKKLDRLKDDLYDLQALIDRCGNCSRLDEYWSRYDRGRNKFNKMADAFDRMVQEFNQNVDDYNSDYEMFKTQCEQRTFPREEINEFCNSRFDPAKFSICK